jgi:PAS domain S-box-containing protein
MKDQYKKKEQLINELKEMRAKLIKNEKTREELELSKDNLEAIINNIPTGVDVVSYDYEIQFQNNFLLERFGNLRGKLCYKSYMGRSNPCSDCPMRSSIENNRVEKAEMEGLDNRVYEILSMPIKNLGGTVSAVEIVTDITDKKLQEAYQNMNTLFQEARDAILIADLESGIILDVNKQAEQLFKRDKSALIGIHQAELHPPEESERYCQIFKKYESIGLKEPLEAEVITRDGQKISVEINASVIKLNGKKQVLQGIFRDITERKQAEKALKQRDKELKKRVKELEDFYEMAVGRELRMKQLKKEIKKLKEEVEKHKKS